MTHSGYSLATNTSTEDHHCFYMSITRSIERLPKLKTQALLQTISVCLLWVITDPEFDANQLHSLPTSTNHKSSIHELAVESKQVLCPMWAINKGISIPLEHVR